MISYARDCFSDTLDCISQAPVTKRPSETEASTDTQSHLDAAEPTAKKPRMSWSHELHQKFVEVVAYLVRHNNSWAISFSVLSSSKHKVYSFATSGGLYFCLEALDKAV